MNNIPDMAEILAQMNEKFLQTAQEKSARLNALLQLLEKEGGDVDEEVYGEFYREIHSLKGMGATFQMPLLSELCKKLEGFLQHRNGLGTKDFTVCRLYFERLEKMINSSDPQDGSLTEKWLKGLPEKP